MKTWDEISSHVEEESLHDLNVLINSPNAKEGYLPEESDAWCCAALCVKHGPTRGC
jgi:hypothetical protein